MDQVDSKKKKKRKRGENANDLANGHDQAHALNNSDDSDLKPKHKKSQHPLDPSQHSTPLSVKKKKKKDSFTLPSPELPVTSQIKKKKHKDEKLTSATPSRVADLVPLNGDNPLELSKPKKKSKKAKDEKSTATIAESSVKKGAKKRKEKDKLKQTTLTESFLGKKVEGRSSKKKKKKNKLDLEKPKKSSEKAASGKSPSKSASTSESSAKDIKRKLKKNKKEDKVGEKKKKRKMDVEKANNNQKFNFGQTIDISDNSSDSTELKIATNDDEDTSELSSEYDSSDSEHIMKNIKSFNKKGASKSSAKKDDEPPPPKVRPRIYSSSDDDDDDSKDEDADDDEDEDDIKEDEDEDKLVDELGDDETPKPDSEDIFFNGWTKADVKQLLNRIQIELPKNDNIKASTRVKQLNWEHIKFGAYSAAQCLEKWKTIEKKIRGYRILQELLTDAQQWLEQPWTDFYRGNKKKYQRHPEMPKKPLTSYMIFYLKKKDKIAKEFPSLPLTDLSKVIAERFNKLAPNKKAKYNELALQMKEDYMAKMKKFAEAHPAEMTRMYNNVGRARRAQNNMPGWSGGFKPVPPVKLFIEDKMKQHHSDRDANLQELQAEYREKWKTMNSKKKLPWIRWAYEAELKYLDELKSYQAENPHYDIPKYKSVLLKEERNLLEKMQGKPDKPPPSAYLLFSSVMLKDPNLRKLTPKERMQETARLWKNVPKVEKDGYAEKVKHLANIYKLEYASYLESLPEDKRKEEMANNLPKRRAKASEDSSLKPAKKARTETKAPPKKPRMSLEELLKKQPTQPPKDAYALFCQDYKDYPEKEIRKSWDALLEAPRSKLEARVEKLKQQYILDMRKFLKSLDPEDLQVYSEYKSSLKQSQPIMDVKLSESDGSDEDEEGSEEDEEDDDGEMEEEEEKKIDVSRIKMDIPEKDPLKMSPVKGGPLKKELSSDDTDDDEEEGEEEKVRGKSSSSSSSDESSSDEEGSSSSSSSSSSSDDDNDANAF